MSRVDPGQLQGQRGVAALGVLVFHAYQFDRSGPDSAYPYAGSWADTALRALDGLVDWFFVLSAFLLALPYARAALRGERATSARVFLLRRAVRVVPLYVIAVLVVWASRNATFPGDWRDLVEHLTFTQVFDRQRVFYTIGPAWSLAVEVQFYVLLALLASAVVALARRLTGPGARLGVLLFLPGLLLVAGGAYAWVVVRVVEPADDDWPWFFGLPAKLPVFGVGVLAAVVVAWLQERRAVTTAPRAAAVLWVVGLAGLVVLAPHRGTTGAADLAFHAAGAPLFAAVVVAGFLGRQEGRWHRLWAAGPVAWVGLVSYSLYLWHEPVLLLLDRHGLVPEQSPSAFPLTLVVLAVAALVVAWVSWWVVEYPASHLRFLVEDAERVSLPPTATSPGRRGYTVDR